MYHPLISVIIPVYNGFRYLDGAVSMLKAQTYENMEIIIVDDGSTDNSFDETLRLTREDERFRIFYKSNGGVSSARNYGVDKSTGDFITFVDVDDYIYPEYFEKLYYMIKKYNADWAQCSFFKVSENFQPRHYENMRVALLNGKTDKELLFDKETAIVDFSYRVHLGGFPFLKLIKRAAAVKLSFREDLKYAEDYVYVYELLKITERVAYLDSVEYLYVQRKESATHIKMNSLSEHQKGWEQLNLIYREMEQVYPQACGGVLEKCYMQAIKNVFRITDKEADKRYLDELYKFIKENGKFVFLDRENAVFRRLLGLFGWVSPEILCAICGVMFRHGFTLRRTA